MLVDVKPEVKSEEAEIAGLNLHLKKTNSVLVQTPAVPSRPYQTRTVPENSENSALVNFGWVTIEDKPALPFIQRGSECYVANQIWKVKLLGDDVYKIFSNTTIKCLSVKMHEMTQKEADVFNEINIYHCDRSLVANHYFKKGERMAYVEDIKRSVTFFLACKNAMLHKKIDNKLFGFIKIASGSEVPFVWNEGQKLVPLFYFEGQSEYLDAKSIDVTDVWKLGYLKFCCLVQNIRRDHYEQIPLKVVDFEDVKKLFPERTTFELCWPEDPNQELLTPEVRIAALHGMQGSPVPSVSGSSTLPQPPRSDVNNPVSFKRTEVPLNCDSSIPVSSTPSQLQRSDAHNNPITSKQNSISSSPAPSVPGSSTLRQLRRSDLNINHSSSHQNAFPPVSGVSTPPPLQRSSSTNNNGIPSHQNAFRSVSEASTLPQSQRCDLNNNYIPAHQNAVPPVSRASTLAHSQRSDLNNNYIPAHQNLVPPVSRATTLPQLQRSDLNNNYIPFHQNAIPPVSRASMLPRNDANNNYISSRQITAPVLNTISAPTNNVFLTTPGPQPMENSNGDHSSNVYYREHNQPSHANWTHANQVQNQSGTTAHSNRAPSSYIAQHSNHEAARSPKRRASWCAHPPGNNNYGRKATVAKTPKRRSTGEGATLRNTTDPLLMIPEGLTITPVGAEQRDVANSFPNSSEMCTIVPIVPLRPGRPDSQITNVPHRSPLTASSPELRHPSPSMNEAVTTPTSQAYLDRANAPVRYTSQDLHVYHNMHRNNSQLVATESHQINQRPQQVIRHQQVTASSRYPVMHNEVAPNSYVPPQPPCNRSYVSLNQQAVTREHLREYLMRFIRSMDARDIESRTGGLAWSFMLERNMTSQKELWIAIKSELHRLWTEMIEIPALRTSALEGQGLLSNNCQPLAQTVVQNVNITNVTNVIEVTNHREDNYSSPARIFSNQLGGSRGEPNNNPNMTSFAQGMQNNNYIPGSVTSTRTSNSNIYSIQEF